MNFLNSVSSIDNTLKKVLTQSRYFWEILENKDSSQINSELFPEQIQSSNALLEHWAQVCSQGNESQFLKRLEWDGWNLENVSSQLGQNISDITFPDWAETLRQVMETALQFESLDESSIHFPIVNLNSKSPVPFEEILAPSVLVARQNLQLCLKQLSNDAGDRYFQLLSESAYQSLEQSLQTTLLDLWIKTLEHEFNLIRPFGRNLLSLLQITGAQTSSTEYYRQFVSHLLQSGFQDFFQKYPVLGRLTATVIDLWVKTSAEFFQHLQTDILEIEQTFGRSPLGKVLEIDPLLSDRHEGGKTVLALTYESGFKLVYKPKSMGLDIAYNELITWCNQNGLPLHLKALKVIDRGTHGWVEYAEHLPCEDLAAGQRFYQRAGMLLCLLYVLRGTDCHFENLIAWGEHPILIDTETLMHPEVQAIEQSLESLEISMDAQQKFWDSVLQVGMLPRWELGHENSVTAYDISGLGSSAPQGEVWRSLQWQAVNTDDMQRVYKPAPIHSRTNVPIVHNEPLSALPYVREVLDGFQQMYHFLVDKRQAMLAKGGCISAFEGQRIRLVFRDTRVYSNLYIHSLTPDFLRNGILRSIELDALSRPFLAAHHRPQIWPMLQSELRAMAQLDIPYFGGLSDCNSLSIGVETPIKDYFIEQSYHQVRFRLEKMGADDLKYQLTLIRGSFYARTAQCTSMERYTAQPLLAKPAEMLLDFTQLKPLTPGQLLAEANALADEIQDNALLGEDGGVAWIGLAYSPNSERYQFRPLGDSLYNGNCGITLFLAALDHITGADSHHDIILGALNPVRKILGAGHAMIAQRYLQQVGLGGGTGLGSILYSLTHISKFLNADSLLVDALDATACITPDLIHSDQVLDLIGGTAGTILGLLTLYRATGEANVLEKAITCGHHLCKAQLTEGSNIGAWITISKTPLTGLSHGAAGIAHALLQLYAETGNEIFREAAKQGIEYEQRVFCPKAENWPDYRTETLAEPEYFVSWCHGAPGIAMARLGSLTVLDTAQIRKDIEIGLKTTRNATDFSIDHLCCGALGRLEALLVAEKYLSSPQLQSQDYQRVAWIIERAKQTGFYRLFPNIPDAVFNPVFAQGTAGIGYQLLRLAAPDKLPSILLWE